MSDSWRTIYKMFRDAQNDALALMEKEHRKMVKQTAGAVIVEASEPSPRWAKIEVNRQKIEGLSMDDLVDLRYCINRILEITSLKDARREVRR